MDVEDFMSSIRFYEYESLGFINYKIVLSKTGAEVKGILEPQKEMRKPLYESQPSWPNSQTFLTFCLLGMVPFLSD